MRPFKGLRDKFAYFASSEHREGLIIEIPDLQGFAEAVRATIVSGID